MRHWSLKLALAIALLLLVLLLVLSGGAFLMVAAYLFFSALWGPVSGALVVAALSLLLAGIVLWGAIRITR